MAWQRIVVGSGHHGCLLDSVSDRGLLMGDFQEFTDGDSGLDVAIVLSEVSSVSGVQEDEDGPETCVVTLKNGAEHHLRVTYLEFMQAAT